MRTIDLEEQLLQSDIGDLYSRMFNYLAETIDEMNGSVRQKLKIYFTIRLIQEIWADYLSKTSY